MPVSRPVTVKLPFGPGVAGDDHGAAQILHLRHSSIHCCSGDRVILPDHQGAERDILKGQRPGLAALDVDLLGDRLLGGVSRRGRAPPSVSRFIEYVVRRDRAAPRRQSGEGRFLTVQVVQIFCAGTAAMGV